MIGDSASSIVNHAFGIPQTLCWVYLVHVAVVAAGGEVRGGQAEVVGPHPHEVRVLHDMVYFTVVLVADGRSSKQKLAYQLSW